MLNVEVEGYETHGPTSEFPTFVPHLIELGPGLVVGAQGEVGVLDRILILAERPNLFRGTHSHWNGTLFRPL